MNKGDIVLVRFPFTDQSGNKLRPAVVLFATGLDLTACFITSQTDWKEDSDIMMSPTQMNGLLKTSLIRTGKIATIDRALAKGLLGRLSNEELAALNDKLRLLLQLN
ncbi:MAG: type II toxin-antitoxin system PemK/MazF family toxin [Bacteroidetes bacterium]|nr:type II toxin-antitoxin system PemK/MazF family toxin [Bacteroidota bacterium]